MTSTTIAAPDGKMFSAYIAVPVKTPAPCVIVIQEIFGINEGIRGKCDWLAREGFFACAPDLFFRLEPNVELTDKTQEEWDKALGLMNRFDADQGVRDLAAAEKFMRAHAGVNGKIGCLGYCLGGKLAYMMAARTDVDASVGYYGVGLDQMLKEAGNIQRPLLLHMAEEDGFVPKDAQAKIKAGLKDNRNVTIHSYPGMDHAFTRVGGAHYNAVAASTADARTIAFLKEHLSAAKSRAA